MKVGFDNIGFEITLDENILSLVEFGEESQTPIDLDTSAENENSDGDKTPTPENSENKNLVGASTSQITSNTENTLGEQKETPQIDTHTENTPPTQIETPKVSAKNIENHTNLIACRKTLQYTDNNMEAIPFLKLCSHTINKNYAGDPLTLEAFINSIQIVQTTTQNVHDDILKDFVISKLESIALETLPDPKPTTTAEVITALRAGIKPDNSEIVAGRMTALKADSLPTQEFSKQAEDLALSFRRSLMNEGISKAKANEMAVKETIKLCKSSSKTSYVKSILASTSFAEPKDVIAKFLTESENERNENKNQILTFRKVNPNRNNNYNNNYNNNNYGNNYNAQFRNNGFQPQPHFRRGYNNYNGYNNNSYNNFNRNRSYRNRNYSNRNNFNANRNSFNVNTTQRNNNQRNNQQNNANSNNNFRNRNIRCIQGNEDVSQVQERTLGTTTEEMSNLQIQ